MSIASIERQHLRERFGFKRRKELADAALSVTVESVPSAVNGVPAEVLARVEAIKNMPIEDIDRSLRSLITLGHEVASENDTQEIPKVITDAIEDAAETMADNWNTDDYNINAVAGITEAFAITHNDAFIEKAAEVISTNPKFAVTVPDIVHWVEFAKEHPDEIDASFNPLAGSGNKTYIPMPIREKSEGVYENVGWVTPVPMETYDYLYAPDNVRTPRTTGKWSDLGQKPL